VQAAVLQVKARYFGSWLDARARIATTYLRELEGLPLYLPCVPRPPAVHAWHAFVVRVPKTRDALAAWLAERGVETRVYYPVPLHEQGAFRAMHDGADLPNAAEACRTALALPLFSAMTEAQQSYVVEQVTRFFG
jgi:dTDP-4-amino-4,6-dideoxygalactose transaminase